jgi:hypothetical protein
VSVAVQLWMSAQKPHEFACEVAAANSSRSPTDHSDGPRSDDRISPGQARPPNSAGR